MNREAGSVTPSRWLRDEVRIKDNDPLNGRLLKVDRILSHARVTLSIFRTVHVHVNISAAFLGAANIHLPLERRQLIGVYTERIS